MQTLSEFFRLEYVPAFLKDRDKRTLTAYKSSINLVVELLDDPTINEVGLYGSVFVRDAIKRGLSAATVAKHCRHLNAVFVAMQTELGYKPGWQLPTVQKHDPKIVTDFEFQQLYRAFGGGHARSRKVQPQARRLGSRRAARKDVRCRFYRSGHEAALT